MPDSCFDPDGIGKVSTDAAGIPVGIGRGVRKARTRMPPSTAKVCAGPACEPVRMATVLTYESACIALEVAGCSVLACALVLIVWHDVRSRVVPNALVGAVACAWILHAGACALRSGSDAAGIDARFAAGLLIFALTGFLLLGGLPLLCAILLECVFDRTEVLGGGDVKLLAALGLWLGPSSGLVMLLSACMLACTVQLVCRLVRGCAPPFPFAPYLACASALVLIGGII